MSGFRVVWWILLVAFVVWLGFSFSRYPLLRPAPATFQSSSGFEGSAQLPVSQTQPHIDRARARMLAINSHGEAFSVAGSVGSWASFLATAAVTLVLGYFGRRAPAENQATDLSGLPSGPARVIGVLAALAAVLTAGGAMAGNQAKDDYQKADSARGYINATISDLAGAKTAQEAQDAIDKLDLEIGRL